MDHLTEEQKTLAAKIAVQNDAFRLGVVDFKQHMICQAKGIFGKTLFTRTVADLDPDLLSDLRNQVAHFDSFSIENNPHGERDFGIIELDEETYYFKFDLYDVEYQSYSPAPADLTQTRRVLTIMHRSEY